MRHIMAATDGSDGADRAVDVAAELAKACGGELSIVSVGGNLSREEVQQLARAEGNSGHALEAISAQTLAAAKTRAQRFGLTHVQLRAGWDDPAQSIMEIAARGPSMRLLLGGTVAAD